MSCSFGCLLSSQSLYSLILCLELLATVRYTYMYVTSRVHLFMDIAMAVLNKEEWKKSAHVLSEKLKNFPGRLWQTIWKVGRDDPRRFVHALKVGLSLTLVSLLYLVEPLFEGIGQNAIWAVMTVVVVLEFTAGQCFSLVIS